jgi:hypothetical protein
MASTTSATGSAAAGIAATRRTDALSSVSMAAAAQRGARIDVADVDHGKEITTAAAR